MSHTAGAVETSDTSSPAGALPDIRLRGAHQALRRLRRGRRRLGSRLTGRLSDAQLVRAIGSVLLVAAAAVLVQAVT